jgi:signal transduction histidine kinase
VRENKRSRFGIAFALARQLGKGPLSFEGGERMGTFSFPSYLGRSAQSLFGSQKFSLKKRVFLVFAALVCFIASGTLYLVIKQNQTSYRNAQVADASRRQTLLGSELLDALSEIDQRARLGEATTWEVRRFRELMQNYTGEFKDSHEAQEMLSRLDIRFQTYIHALSGADPIRGTDQSRTLLRTYYQDVANTVNGLIELNANSTFKTLHEINLSQENASRTALYFLAMFILLCVVAGCLIFAVVTRPLNSLVNFLDRVNVEDDLPGELPQLDSHAPETALVAKSFEQLLQRLRGYRALNVRRLLIEKRRADIIAASITDGIFLLRGDEILYVNPIAQRMLECNRVGKSSGPGGGPISNGGMAPVGMSLRSLAEATSHAQGQVQIDSQNSSQNSEDDRSNRCARAILASITQTMPVEMEVEERDRKSYYLIQAYPISYDLIEQIEHSVKGPLEQILDRFQANTIVVAQDVTLVRESQEAKGHFLATLSHEIKTPVTSLTMATRLLSKMIQEIPNPTHRNLILTCVEDVDRLRRLLDDLLTISRFDLMIQKLEFQNIDLVKLLKNSVQSFQVQARQRDIALTFAAQGKDENERFVKNLMIPMDPSKIAWAISNLLTNALRHTPRGGAVEARLIHSSDDWVEIRVKDSGPGIELKRQSRIFDKFSSFYDIRVARSGSTGAGLSIAREIVTAHGGRIWVSSEPGQGAEFGFTLPIKRKMSETLPKSEASQSKPVAGSLPSPGDSTQSNESHNLKSSAVASEAVAVDSVQEVSMSLVKKGASSGASACG